MFVGELIFSPFLLMINSTGSDWLIDCLIDDGGSTCPPLLLLGEYPWNSLCMYSYIYTVTFKRPHKNIQLSEIAWKEILF